MAPLALALAQRAGGFDERRSALELDEALRAGGRERRAVDGGDVVRLGRRQEDREALGRADFGEQLGEGEVREEVHR